MNYLTECPDVFTQQIHRLEYMVNYHKELSIQNRIKGHRKVYIINISKVFNLEDQIAHLKDLQDARNRK